MNKLLLGCVLGSSMLASCNNVKNKMNNISKKTNVIFIVADDLGYGDLSCYGVYS